MFKNSREIFERYLVELVPAAGLSLAKSKPEDFAVYKFADSSILIALLNVGRAFGRRRFDGVIGLAAADGVQNESRGRIAIAGYRSIHIANIEPLLSVAYIDESDVEDSVSSFLRALAEEFRRLSASSFDRGLTAVSTTVMLTPAVDHR